MAQTIIINGDKLKQLREQYDLSQEGLEFACSQKKGCRVSIATIKRAELGHALSRRSASRLALFFSVPLEYLIMEDIREKAARLFVQSRKNFIVIWLKTDSACARQWIDKQFSYLHPVCRQLIGHTLVVAIPCHQAKRKNYLPVQKVVLEAKSLFIQADCWFSALITLAPFQQHTEHSWMMEDGILEIISETASHLHNQTIAVCESLCQASIRYYQYQTENLAWHGFRQLTQLIAIDQFTACPGREKELIQINQAVDRLLTENTSVIVTISGDEGMGKSHLFYLTANAHPVRHWHKIRLDFATSVAGIDVIQRYLYQSLLSIANASGFDKMSESTHEVVDLIRILTKTQPLFIHVDDLELADESLFISLTNIIQQTKESPVLWGFAYGKTKDSSIFHHRLCQCDPEMISIFLKPMNTCHLMAWAGKKPVTCQAIHQQYCEISAGNPYIFLELYRHATPADHFPETLTFLIQCHYDALSGEDKQIMAILSLTQHPLLKAELCQYCAASEDILLRLETLNLICCLQCHTVILKYPWIKDVVRINLSPQEKCFCYRQLAEITEKKTSNSRKWFSLTADYYCAAHDDLQAARILYHHGEQLLAEGNYTDARQNLNAALKYIQKANPNPSDALLLDIRLALAAITRIVHGWVSHCTIAAYQHCLMLAKQQLDPVRQCIALAGFWVTQLMSTNLLQAEKIGFELLKIAKKSGEDRCISMAYSCLSNTQFWLAKHHDAIYHAEQSIQHYLISSGHKTSQMFGINPLVHATCFGSLSASVTNNNEKLKNFRQYYSQACITGNSFDQAIYIQSEIWVYYHQRNYTKVLFLSQRLIQLSEQNHFPFYTGFAMLFCGWARFFTQNSSAEEALQQINEGYHHWLTSTGDQIAYSLYILVKSELCIQINRRDEATQLLLNAIIRLKTGKEACYLSPMYSRLALLIPGKQAEYQHLAHKIATQQKATLFLKKFWLE